MLNPVHRTIAFSVYARHPLAKVAGAAACGFTIGLLTIVKLNRPLARFEATGILLVPTAIFATAAATLAFVDWLRTKRQSSNQRKDTIGRE